MYAKAIALFAVVALAAPAPEPTPAPDAELLNRMVERQLGGGIPGIAGASLIGNQVCGNILGVQQCVPAADVLNGVGLGGVAGALPGATTAVVAGTAGTVTAVFTGTAGTTTAVVPGQATVVAGPNGVVVSGFGMGGPASRPSGVIVAGTRPSAAIISGNGSTFVRPVTVTSGGTRATVATFSTPSTTSTGTTGAAVATENAAAKGRQALGGLAAVGGLVAALL